MEYIDELLQKSRCRVILEEYFFVILTERICGSLTILTGVQDQFDGVIYD